MDIKLLSDSLIENIFLPKSLIDQNKIYHLGHSIKDLGKKIFSISESDSNLISKLLSNI